MDISKDSGKKGSLRDEREIREESPGLECVCVCVCVWKDTALDTQKQQCMTEGRVGEEMF